MNNTDRRVIISSTSGSSINTALKQMEGRNFKWIHFGEDILVFIKLENTIGKKVERIEIADILQKTARYLRQKYVDYIGTLSVEHNSLEWWANPLSEKNPYVSKAFINSCFTKTALKIISENPKENLIFFVEQECVRRTIYKNHKNVIMIDSSLEKIANTISDAKTFILYNWWFLFKNLYSIFLSRIYGLNKSKAKRDLTLIYSPINPHSFDKEGNYHESFFGELQERLEKSGKNTAIFPFLWVSLLKYPNLMKNMKKSDKTFIYPHSFISFVQIFKLFFHNLFNRPKTTEFPIFEEIDISPIINYDLLYSWLRAREISNLLFYDMVKSLKRNNIDVGTFIYIYENLAREKMMCSAFRKFYSSSYLIGYQHSAFPIMRNDYFFSKQELNVIPFPDRIITNGKHFYDLFIKNGYPEYKVVKGTAIRYKHLSNLEQKTEPLNTVKPRIAITPSIDKFEANSLVWLAFKAFENQDNMNIIIKCHPFHPFKKISNDLKLKIPKHFTVSEERLDKLLPKTDVLLYTSSTTSVEALVMGVPIVNVNSANFIDLDPLSYDSGLRYSAGTSQELSERVKTTLSIDEKSLSEKRKFWKNSVINLLDKVDEDTYNLFMRPGN